MKLTTLFAAAALALGVSSCSDDDNVKSTPAEVGDAISFTVGTKDSRTVYGEGDGKDHWKIYWNFGTDKVSIFSNQALGSKQCAYVVENYSGNDAVGGSGKLRAVTDGSQLKWGLGVDGKADGDGLHHFYASYPSTLTDMKYVTKTWDGGNSAEYAVFTCPVVFSQNVTVASTATNGVYAATPDMSNQYMFSSTDGRRKGDQANAFMNFYFHPIMTTLEVTIKRGTENLNDVSPVIQGVTVTADIPQSVANDKKFYYAVKENGDASGYTISDADAKTLTETETSSEQFTASIVGGTLESGTAINGVELGSGESVTLTIFLPPVDAKYLKLHVLGTNIASNVDATISGTIQKGQKKVTTLTLPEKATDSNNWITPLDDNIYVSQLSIPGTHDAATGEGMDFTNSWTGSWTGTGSSLNSIGVTQSLTIQKQLQAGIRAFDFRTAYRTSSNNLFVSREGGMFLWHGIACTKKKLDSALEDIVSYLKDNPQEMVVIQFRNESEKFDGTIVKTTKDNDKWQSEMATSLNKVADYIVQWKPDLTLKEARGKIVLLSRDQFSNDKVGFITGFPTGDGGTNCVTYQASIAAGSASTTYYVQDNYDTHSQTNCTYKIKLVKDFLDASAKFCTDAAKKNYWCLNHTSGYSKTVTIAGSDLGTTEGYQANASTVNKAMYDYITGTEYKPGPTGIVFMDYAGGRKAGNYTTYGDLLPGALINNNYKYRMVRSTDK